jgi:hypothetical protein
MRISPAENLDFSLNSPKFRKGFCIICVRGMSTRSVALRKMPAFFDWLTPSNRESFQKVPFNTLKVNNDTEEFLKMLMWLFSFSSSLLPRAPEAPAEM